MIRTLIVDDSSAVRDAVREILEAAGCEIDEAGNGQECIEMAERTIYDAILLDWNMPILNGIDCLRALRQDPRHKHTRIVIVTMEDDFAQIALALEAGADEYVIKPFDDEIIVSKLRSVGVAV